MMEPPPPEFSVICIDNGRRAVYCEEVYHAQVKAARLYCKTVLECNPKSIVSILTMSSLGFGELVRPTSDLEQIMSALRYVPCQGEGETEVQWALARACATFSRAPSDMKKRLLMFVGSTISLHLSEASSYGEKLNESGVAVNVFNFFWLKVDSPYFNKNASVLEGNYHYGRAELDTLVTEANDNGNSHIVDITDNYESSALDTLSKTTLKEHLHYLEKKAAADDKNVEAPQIHFVKPESERSHDEKNKSVTHDEYGQATVIGYGNLSKKKAEKNVNVKNQNSAADDECVQAPGMEYLSKKTPRLSRKKKKKNNRKR